MRLQAEDDAITAQNDAIWGLIAPFLANQIARITIDFKMSIIKTVIPPVCIGQQPMSRVKTYKLLGLWIDDDLNWESNTE